MKGGRSPSAGARSDEVGVGDATVVGAAIQSWADAIAADSAGSILSVVVTPRSGRSALAGVEDGYLRVRVAAPPVVGAANKALVRFLADVIGVSPSRIRIVAGATGRRKRLRVVGLVRSELATRLGRST